MWRMVLGLYDDDDGDGDDDDDDDDGDGEELVTDISSCSTAYARRSLCIQLIGKFLSIT